MGEKKFVLVPSETGGRIYERGRETPGKAKAAIEYSDYRDNWIVTYFGLMPFTDTLSDARLKKSLSKHFTKKEIDSVLEKRRKRAKNSFSRNPKRQRTGSARRYSTGIHRGKSTVPRLYGFRFPKKKYTRKERSRLRKRFLKKERRRSRIFGGKREFHVYRKTKRSARRTA